MNTKKLLIVMFVVVICNCFAEHYSYTKFNFNPNINFSYDQNNIVLKLNKTSGWFNSNEQTYHFNYIIDIKKKIENNCVVYLCLNDSDGFQLRNKIFIENVSKGFNGFLKGNFTISLSENEKICGAELFYYSD